LKKKAQIVDQRQAGCIRQFPAQQDGLRMLLRDQHRGPLERKRRQRFMACPPKLVPQDLGAPRIPFDNQYFCNSSHMCATALSTKPLKKHAPVRRHRGSIHINIRTSALAVVPFSYTINKGNTNFPNRQNTAR
jgi:hypothetical protein